MTRSMWAGVALAAAMLALAFSPVLATQEDSPVVTIQMPHGQCSAVHVGDGEFLTARHCFPQRLRRLSHLHVAFAERDEKLTLQSRDPDTDIATLQAHNFPASFPAVDTRCDIPSAGELARMVGNPMGMGLISMPAEVVHGAARVSHLHPALPDYALALTSGLGRGMSGGAVLDATGRLIGINSAMVDHISLAARIADLPQCRELVARG